MILLDLNNIFTSSLTGKLKLMEEKKLDVPISGSQPVVCGKFVGGTQKNFLKLNAYIFNSYIV